jgi:hypothetical protein
MYHNGENKWCVDDDYVFKTRCVIHHSERAGARRLPYRSVTYTRRRALLRGYRGSKERLYGGSRLYRQPVRGVISLLHDRGK